MHTCTICTLPGCCVKSSWKFGHQSPPQCGRFEPKPSKANFNLNCSQPALQAVFGSFSRLSSSLSLYPEEIWLQSDPEVIWTHHHHHTYHLQYLCHHYIIIIDSKKYHCHPHHGTIDQVGRVCCYWALVLMRKLTGAKSFAPAHTLYDPVQCQFYTV